MPNPFFFAGKITNPAHFVGREKELKRIFGYTHEGLIVAFVNDWNLATNRVSKSCL